MGVPSVSCMENQRDCTSTCPVAVVSAAHGDLNVTYGDLNEVREIVGHVDKNTDSTVENFVVGPDGNACDNEAQCDFINESINNESVRPSYITQRPKRGSKKMFPQVFESGLPDLNQEAVNTSDSDPFNIDEIFRMEEQIQGEVAGGSNRQVNREEAGVS
ncbi:hypothetical protein Hanom_Chr01g00049601 [Helianthus anomalus]